VERIRRALVTGASDGIGAGLARALAARGVEFRMEVEPVVAGALRDLPSGRAVSTPGGLNRPAVVGATLAPTAVSRRVSASLHRRFTA
jgi:NAD(P)-dependent dehydrogenase (short-subunit alcohol dehydrogenase family)